MTNDRDQILIENYFNGDQEAFETLMQSYLKPIYNFAYRYTGDAAGAEDIAQEVFVKVWRNLKKFDRTKSFKTWIFVIAKNTALDFLKKKKAVPFSAFNNEEGENIIIETLADPAPLPPELFARKELAQMLERAMSLLAPKYREVLLLRYFEHFTFQEIADVLHEPLDTVKSRCRRACIMLKKTVEQ